MSWFFSNAFDICTPLCNREIQAGLVDEYHLFINPAAIGKGMTIFGNLGNTLGLTLMNTVKFGCGIVVNTYKPKPD